MGCNPRTGGVEVEGHVHPVTLFRTDDLEGIADDRSRLLGQGDLQEDGTATAKAINEKITRRSKSRRKSTSVTSTEIRAVHAQENFQ